MPETINIKKKKELEIRSQAIDEIIGHPPKWIVRWGITLFTFIAMGLLFMTWVFKYPDIIQAPVIVITENVPATLTAKSSGRIIKAFYAEGDNVEKGANIALIENPADYKDILLLSSIIDSLSKNWISKTNEIQTSPEALLLIDSICKSNNKSLSTFILGSVDASWSSFFVKWNEYKEYLEKDYDGQKIKALKSRLLYYNQLTNQYQQQNELAKEEYNLSLKQFKRDSSLYLKKVICEQEYETSKKTLLQKATSKESFLLSLIQSQLQNNETEQTIIEQENNREAKIKQFQLQLTQLFSNLQNSLDLWKQTYLIVSPVKGKMTYPKVWAENQNIQVGEPVATIIPYGKSKIIGKVNLSVSGSGKVKKGQKVIIKLDNYPYMEYGLVTATVENMSLVPTEKTYMLELSFPNGLVSNYGKNLEYRDEMTGSAEIITEDMRLIERLINPIRYLLKRNKN